MRPTLFGTVAGSASLPFDNISMANAGLWDLRKVRTSYEGYAVRAGLAADSGATTLDIGFNADGSFDMAAYEAFGTGSERIVTWYDQSGNGFDLERAWSSACPIVRTSTYNSQPCIYFAGGSLGNASFNEWSGLTDFNVFVAQKFSVSQNAYIWTNGAGSRGLYTTDTDRNTLWGAFYASDSQYYYASRSAGSYTRSQYDGDGATDALKGRFYLNTVERTRNTSTGSWPATYPSGAGFYISGNAAGSGALQYQCEYFAVYYLGQSLTSGEVAGIDAYVNDTYFNFTDNQIFCCGDSLTLNSANGGPSDPDAYPNLLVNALEGDGSTWNLFSVATSAESAAQTERVLQLAEGSQSVFDTLDVHYPNHVVVIWAGTNDLAAGDSAATALTGSLNLTTATGYRYGTCYYLNMLPRKDLGAGNAAFEVSRVTYNAGLAATLGATATVVDVASLLPDCEDLTYYLSDKVHLNDAGNAVVANAVAAAIEADL